MAPPSPTRKAHGAWGAHGEAPGQADRGWGGVLCVPGWRVSAFSATGSVPSALPPASPA